MSRSQLTICLSSGAPEWTVAWGTDSTVGRFFQVFDASDECFIDEDELFTGLTSTRIRELARTYGVEDDLRRVGFIR